MVRWGAWRAINVILVAVATVAYGQLDTPSADDFRVWVDSTDKYTTEAVMTEFSGGKVHLRKRDGTTVRVSVGKLSRSDQRFVRDELARRKGSKTGPRMREGLSPDQTVHWPGWRGPKRDGKSPDTGLLTQWPAGGPPLLWRASGLGQGYSTVAVVDEMVYTSGVVGQELILFAYDMQGELKWRVSHGQAHSKRYPGSRSTPTIDEGQLYILSGNGIVGCYDARNGRGNWTRSLSQFGGDPPDWGYAESVLIHKELAVVTPGGSNCVMALNKNTGRPVWSTRGLLAGAQYGSCYAFEVDGVPIIATGTREGLVGIDPENGRVLFANPFSANNTANCPTPAYSDGCLFWANGYGSGGICLKLDVRGRSVTANQTWTTRDMDCQHGGYIIHQGHIYGNHQSTWVCLDLQTGETIWQERGVGKGSVCYADGMLYLFSENGGRVGLATCSPDGLEMRGMFSVDGRDRSWAHPVVIGGRLYLRYADNLYCFDVRA